MLLIQHIFYETETFYAMKLTRKDTGKRLNSNEHLVDSDCEFCWNVKRVVVGAIAGRQEPIVVHHRRRLVESYKGIHLGRIVWQDLYDYGHFAWRCQVKQAHEDAVTISWGCIIHCYTTRWF